MYNKEAIISNWRRPQCLNRLYNCHFKHHSLLRTYSRSQSVSSWEPHVALWLLCWTTVLYSLYRQIRMWIRQLLSDSLENGVRTGLWYASRLPCVIRQTAVLRGIIPIVRIFLFSLTLSLSIVKKRGRGIKKNRIQNCLKHILISFFM